MDCSLPGSSVHGIRSLGQDDPLEKGMAIHSSILAGSHSLLQGIILTLGSNSRFLSLLHCKWILYH